MSLTWMNFLLCVWTGLVLHAGPCDTIVQPPMVLRRNHMAVIQRSDEIADLTPMVSCLKTIARGWFNDDNGVSLLVPNFLENPDLSKLFFTGLQTSASTFSFTEDFSEFQGFALSAVILVRNSTDFDKLNALVDLCASNCRYVVCLLDFHKDKASLLSEADEVVKAMWRMRVAKVVIIASAEGTFFVAGTYSFKLNTDTALDTPEILAECNALSTGNNTRIFHKLLMNNCLINVTVSDCHPYAQLVEKEGHSVLIGLEGDMFETIARSLNISLNRRSMSAEENRSVYNDLLNSLDSSVGNDVVFCGLYWGKSDAAEYTLPYEREEVVWLVPPRPALSLLGLVTPLTPHVWFAIIGLLVFTGIIKVLLFRKLSLLTVVGLILGNGLPRQPNTLSNRIQFMSWIFFGYIITQSYLASLAGQLMNTNVQQIETMEQLENSGISLGGTARHKDLFRDDKNLVRLYNKYQTLTAEENDEVLAAMEAGKNTTMALVKEIKLSNVVERPGPYDPHKLAETLAGYPIVLAVWKKLPYLDQINTKVYWLVETGLIIRWSRIYANVSSFKVDIHVSDKLDLLHLTPSFFLLLIGHALSLVVFLIEIGIHVRKNHRLKKRNKVDKKIK